MMSILDPKIENNLKQHDVAYTVLDCDPEYADTAAFCEHYDYTPEQSANTIIVMSRKIEPIKYIVCVLLATTKLDVNKKVCQLMDVKKASFADAETTIQLTSMMIGGVCALGITDLPIYVDSRVLEQPEIVMGGGNRSSKVVLAPSELKRLLNVEIVADLALLKD